jgi:hypothetical protein
MERVNRDRSNYLQHQQLHTQPYNMNDIRKNDFCFDSLIVQQNLFTKILFGVFLYVIVSLIVDWNLRMWC